MKKIPTFAISEMMCLTESVVREAQRRGGGNGDQGNPERLSSKHIGRDN